MSLIYYGRRKLLQYAKKTYPDIKDENELLGKALYDFKIDAAKVAFSYATIAKRRDLRLKWHMDRSTAFQIIRQIPEKEREELLKVHAVELDDMTKKEILTFHSTLEKKKFNTLTGFVKFEQLPEVIALKRSIERKTRRYQVNMVIRLRTTCVRLSEFHKRVLLPKDLIDPDISKDLFEQYWKHLIEESKLQAKEYVVKTTGREDPDMIDRTWQEGFVPHTFHYRAALRALTEAHGFKATVSGEKDPRRKKIIRIITEDEEFTDESEAVQPSMTKPQFVQLVQKLKTMPEPLKHKALACFLVGTGARIAGARSIWLKDMNLKAVPPYAISHEKKTKVRATGEWTRYLNDFVLKAICEYLADRYKTNSDLESIIKVCEEHKEDALFPEAYQVYRRHFRKALDELGFTGVTHPFHSLRHAWVEWMAATALAENTLAMANLGGWDDPSTMCSIYFGSPIELLASWFLEAQGKKKREPVPFEKGLEEV